MADNAGYDSAQLVSELRAIHTDGKQTWGISKFLLFSRISSAPTTHSHPYPS